MVMGPFRADSAPYDGNATLRGAWRAGGVAPGTYTRDLAIAATLCFTGKDRPPVTTG